MKYMQNAENVRRSAGLLGIIIGPQVLGLATAEGLRGWLGKLGGVAALLYVLPIVRSLMMVGLAHAPWWESACCPWCYSQRSPVFCCPGSVEQQRSALT